jgi:hypothetical protein
MFSARFIAVKQPLEIAEILGKPVLFGRHK